MNNFSYPSDSKLYGKEPQYTCSKKYCQSLSPSSYQGSTVLSLDLMLYFHYNQNMRYSQGFWYFAWSRSHEVQVNPRNPAKFTKTQKIPQNSVEILSNTCLYNIFETYFSYRGYLLAVNLQIYLGTSSLKRANRLCCEKLGTSHDVKGFAIGSFLEHIVVERANDDLC